MKVPAIVFAATMALALTACGSENSDAPSPALNKSAITEWGGEAIPPEQLQYTADGVVTEAEVTLAYEDLIKCMDERAPIIRSELVGFRNVQSYLDEGLDNDDFLPYQGVQVECENIYTWPLDAIFDYQNLPVGEEREAAFADFQECLSTYGTLPDTIYLGQPQHVMMRAVTDVNIEPEFWPVELHDCLQRNYRALWPETIPGNPDYQ